MEVPFRRHSNLDRDCSCLGCIDSGGVKKWSNLQYVLKIEPVGFTDSTNMKVNARVHDTDKQSRELIRFGFNIVSCMYPTERGIEDTEKSVEEMQDRLATRRV